MSYHTVKGVLEGVSVQILKENFNDQILSAGGIITDDAIPADIITGMTADQIGKIRTSEIEFWDNTPIAKIYNWDKPNCDRIDYIDLSEKSSTIKTGLPLPIQERLVRDLAEFQELTGRRAVTHLYIGDRLETEWHSMKSKGRATPLMIRDLSGHGMYYAVPQGLEFQVKAEKEHAAHMVDKGALKAAFANSSLLQKQLPAGHRIFCNEAMIRREHWVASDLKPRVTDLRSYTAVYSF